MKAWYKKDTANEDGDFIGGVVTRRFPEAWDNPDNLWTSVVPPFVCRTQGIPCVWSDTASTWVADPHSSWEFEIKATDKSMPRSIEDIWDVMGIGSASEHVRNVYNNKKEIRGRKPV